MKPQPTKHGNATRTQTNHRNHGPLRLRCASATISPSRPTGLGVTRDPVKNLHHFVERRRTYLDQVAGWMEGFPLPGCTFAVVLVGFFRWLVHGDCDT